MPRTLPLLAALVSLALSTSAAVPPPAQLLPPDTLAVLSIPDFNQMVAARQRSPMMKLCHDPAMRPFVDKFTSKLQATLIQPFEQKLGFKLTDWGSLLQGQVTFAVTQNGWSGTKEKVPAFVVIVDSGSKSDQLKQRLAAIRKKLTDAGQAIHREKIRDVEFTVVPLQSKKGDDTPKPELRFGQVGSVCLAGTSTSALEQVLVRLSGGSGPCLADQPAFEADQQRLFRGTLAYGWIHFAPLGEIILKKAASSAHNPQGPSPDRVLTALGLKGLKTFAASCRESAAGTGCELFVGAPAAERKGLLKLFATEAKNSAPPAFVPADVTEFSRWRIDGQKVWSTIEATVNEISPGLLDTMLAMPEQTIKQKDPSFDFRKGLIGNLGDDIITFRKAPRSSSLADLNSPPVVTLLASPNCEQLLQSIRSLITGLSGMIPAMSGLQIKEREFLGHKIYSVPLPSMPNPAGGKPTERSFLMTTAGGYVAFSTDTALLEAFLRNGAHAAKPLAERPGLGQAAQRVGGMQTGLFGFLNDQANVRIVVQALKENEGLINQLFAMSPLGKHSQGTGEPAGLKQWLDFSLLPSFDQIAKYFSFTVYAGQMTPRGYLLHCFTPTPPQLRQ